MGGLKMETYNRDRHLHGVEEYEQQVHQSTGRDFSIGLILGLAVGTIGGLLLAPKSGDALRDDITVQANKLSRNLGTDEPDSSLKEKAEQKTNELRDKLKDKKDEAVVKKSEMDEKNRVKSIDESDMKAQKEAIQEEVSEDYTKDARTVDMSKYEEKNE